MDYKSIAKSKVTGEEDNGSNLSRKDKYPASINIVNFLQPNLMG